MQQPQVEYRNAIRALGSNQDAPPGFEVISLNRKGELVAGISAFVTGKHRIAVHRNFHKSITNATARVKHFLEPQIFQTREKAAFNLHLRIKIDPSNIVDIARKHFDEVLEPEDLFFMEFANLLRNLLEHSARKEAGTVDQRIRNNREIWQAELEKDLSQRFGIGVEIIFDIEREVSVDKCVRTEPGEYCHVYFHDRIDKTYPLQVDLKLHQEPLTPKSTALQREDSKLKANIFDTIAKACEQDLMLYDYWFDHDRMQKTIKDHLNAYLADYAHSVARLQVTPPILANNEPPPEREKLAGRIIWHDNRGYELEFRAEASALIARDGAGLYDKQGRPNRNAWFTKTISEALKHQLSGLSIVDLDEKKVENHSEEIEQSLVRQAKSIGLDLSRFNGKADLPNQKWNQRTFVSVPVREYKTSHSKITGEFSMEIDLVFSDRKTVEVFMNEYHQSKLYQDRKTTVVDGASRALPDEFIEQQIIDVAIDVTANVMQGIDANDYITDFIRQKDWDYPISSLEAPGTRSGFNIIQDRVFDTLKKRYPGLKCHELRFHRKDQNLEKLRSLIASLAPIRFECVIEDHNQMNAALDRELEGYIFIERGDAERVVWMLNLEFDKLSPLEYGNRIRNHVTKFVENKLFRASHDELNSLMGSLTERGSRYDDSTRKKLKVEIRETIRKNFGVVCGDIELSAKMSDDYQLLKKERRDAAFDHIRMNQIGRASLKATYQAYYNELQKITGTSEQDEVRRKSLRGELEDIHARMTALQEDASGLYDAPSSEHIDIASSLFDTTANRKDGGAARITEKLPREPQPKQILDMIPDEDDDQL